MQIEGHTLAALPLNPGAAGQPLVLLHGITGSINFWITAPPPYLLEQGPCYALSLPGHSPAAFPAGFRAESLTAEMIARVLAAAIRELVGSQPVTLIGHSSGGFAALSIAAHTPEIAQRVLSIAGFAHGQWTGALGLYQRLVRSGSLGQGLFKAIYKSAGASRTMFRLGWTMYVADRRAMDAYPYLDQALNNTHPDVKRLDLDAMIHYFSRMPEIDISNLLPRITAPTLAVAGERDPIVPPAQARLVAHEVPNAELALIEGAGHMPFLERPAEYERVVSSWLRKTACNAST
ncbi:MAG: alpha/beta hydrolase [Thermoflexales bacterium]|nr:alpha/beta hydrolase [Thermoflexales bacterium]